MDQVIVPVTRAELTELQEPSDAWVARVAGLLADTANECQGEPAVGMWTLKREGRVVGCVAIRRRKRNGRLELCRLNVRAQFRGRGLSRQLVKHALNHAHFGSPEAVTAQAAGDNWPALAVLREFGMREISRTGPDAEGQVILLLEETTR